MTAATGDGARFGSGYRALVVEDELASRVMTRELLGGVGFDVIAVESLGAARERLAKERFDLAVVDNNLGDENGMDLVRSQTLTGCAVVLVSAFANLSSALEAMQRGVQDYVLKPFDHADFMARVRRVMEGVALKRSNALLLSSLKEKNRDLEEMAARDPLTKLYNHGHFHDALQREVQRSQRYGNELAVAMIDVDEFKRINDAHGHLAGDAVISALGEVLRQVKVSGTESIALRAEDIATRYGGDEFAIILPQTPASGAAVWAERLRRYVETTNLRVPSPVTISIGIAGYPADAATREELIDRADAALHAAKRAGRNRLVTWSPSLLKQSRQTEEVELAAAFEESLRGRAFDYVFQPIVRMGDASIFGFEALCRPRNPGFPAPPALFATAERLGRITDLGRVLRELCAGPLAEAPADAIFFINVHPLELYDPQLGVDEPMLRALASRIVFEVTETSEIKDFGKVKLVLQRLRACGFRVALDDLGAGYAGLQTLAMLGPDFVKLDIGLVRNLEANPRAGRLIRHILEYADGEGMQVVAEGVETVAEAAAVASLGVELAQGYHFARPGPPFPAVESKR